MEIGPVVSDKKILKFSIQIYSENKPRPLAAMFFDKSKWLEQSWLQDHQRNISTKLYGNRSSGFGQEDF